MSMKKVWISCLVLLLFAGCVGEKESSQVVNLKHEVLDLPDMLIGSPGDMLKDGDCLIVLDYQHDSLFHRIDLKENRYMGMFGAKGQGPSDFVHPSHLNSMGDGTFSCYDASTNQLSRIGLGAERNKLNVSRVLKNNAFMTFGIVPLSDSLFVVNGETDGAMFALIDKEETVLSVSDEYPYKDEEERKIPVRFRAMAYQGILRVNVNGCFAYAVSGAKQLHMYKVENNVIKKVGEVIDDYGHYKPEMGLGDGYAAARDSRYPEAYVDLAITDDCLYALYSGRSFKEYKMRIFECETIYVYDWAGKLLKTYQLDVPITRFCLDEDGDKLYAIANIPEPTIVSFTLD